MPKIYSFIILNNMQYIYTLLLGMLLCHAAAAQSDTLQHKQISRPGMDTLLFNGQRYTYFLVDLKEYDIRFFWKDPEGRLLSDLGNLKTLIDTCYESDLIFATNGGMYLDDQSPQGLYIENGRWLRPADTLKGGYGNFYMEPNGVFLITESMEAGLITTDSFRQLVPEYSPKIRYATQSGPMVLHEGAINPIFVKGSRNLNIRSGVGWLDPGRIVFLISEDRVNFYDFASVFKERFACREALYLDGAISRIYLPTLNRYDTGGRFGVMIAVLK
jgi:uncharacterized protein YigE (DUF2233 family)